MQAGSSVTLTVSRGVDYGDNAEVPSVVGMSKDDALTTLGKFIDIQITEQQSYRGCRNCYRTGTGSLCGSGSGSANLSDDQLR